MHSLGKAILNPLHFAVSVSVIFGSSGCFAIQTGYASRTSPAVETLVLPDGTRAPVLSDGSGIVTARLGANATETQLVTASADSNISDVVLAFPPGSLSINTNISLREAPTIGSELLLTQLGLSATPTVTNSGAAVEITSSEPIDLAHPMILALPLPAGFGLSEIDRSHLGVLYRISIQDTAEKKVGFVPASELTIDATNKILYPSSYFGSFQVVVFDQVVPKIEKDDTVPTHDGISFILAGTAIPGCGRADVGRTIYVEEEKQFQFCSGTGWQEVDLKGPAGPQGEAGPEGPAGSASASSASTGTLYVYDSAGVKLGKFLGNNGIRNYYTQLLDGTSILLNSDGTTQGMGMGSCYYTTSDCTGTCYGGASLVVGDVLQYVEGKDIAGAATHYWNGVKVTGKVTAAMNYNSRWQMNSCNPTPTTAASYTTFALYTPLTFTAPLQLKAE